MENNDLIDSIIKSNEMKMKTWEKYMQEEIEREESRDLIRKSLNSNSTSKIECAICGKPMTEDGRKPIAISPCGHTVCSFCLEKSAKYCPICNKLISQKATNFSVQQIAETLSEKHVDTPDYKKQFAQVELRMQELFDKLESNKQQRESFMEQERVAKAVIEHLDSELHTLRIKKDLLKEQLEDAQNETKKEQEVYDDLNEIVQKLRFKTKKEKLENVIKENA